MNIGTVVAPVEGALREAEDLLYRQAEGFHPDLKAALHHLLQAGGKRVRPSVALLSGSLVGADKDALVYLAAALEMLHTATLVHDDLIDGALLRRGVPTLNAQWSPAATVLTGDFLFARAARLAAQTQSVRVMERFAETLSVIVDGEIHQLFEGARYTDLDTYYWRIYAKTASLFELATTGAALLGHPSSEEADALQRYGYALGMAFQIVDDVLDFRGDERQVGKPVGRDLQNGIVTLPTLLYHLTRPEDPTLRGLLAGRRLSTEEVQALVERIRASGAVDRALEEARRFVRQAMEALEVFPPSPERDSLAYLARYVVERNR